MEEQNKIIRDEVVKVDKTENYIKKYVWMVYYY